MEDYQARLARIVQTVEIRQREIGTLLITTTLRANRLARYAAFSKVITIVIGAFIATSGAAQIVFGEEGGLTVLVAYSLLGVVISAMVALSTAFRYDERSSGLNRLSVDCRAAMLDLHYRFQRTVEGVSGQLQIDAGLQMLLEWDRQLMILRQRASELGLIVVTEYQSVAGEPQRLVGEDAG